MHDPVHFSQLDPTVTVFLVLHIELNTPRFHAFGARRLMKQLLHALICQFNAHLI
jgi:hypothetical protein